MGDNSQRLANLTTNAGGTTAINGGAITTSGDQTYNDAVTLDALVERTGVAPAELSARLLELELEDRVARLPGGLYQRRTSA